MKMSFAVTSHEEVSTTGEPCVSDHQRLQRSYMSMRNTTFDKGHSVADRTWQVCAGGQAYLLGHMGGLSICRDFFYTVINTIKSEIMNILYLLPFTLHNL